MIGFQVCCQRLRPCAVRDCGAAFVFHVQNLDAGRTAANLLKPLWHIAFVSGLWFFFNFRKAKRNLCLF